MARTGERSERPRVGGVGSTGRTDLSGRLGDFAERRTDTRWRYLFGHGVMAVSNPPGSAPPLGWAEPGIAPPSDGITR